MVLREVAPVTHRAVSSPSPVGTPTLIWSGLHPGLLLKKDVSRGARRPDHEEVPRARSWVCAREEKAPRRERTAPQAQLRAGPGFPVGGAPPPPRPFGSARSLRGLFRSRCFHLGHQRPRKPGPGGSCGKRQVPAPPGGVSASSLGARPPREPGSCASPRRSWAWRAGAVPKAAWGAPCAC